MILGLFPKKDKIIALEALDRVNILEKAHDRADSLSGGQQQRVSIARALSQQPKIILADEPTASLDPKTTRQVMNDLKRINEEMGITIIINLHFIDLALEYGERIIGMRDGKVVYDDLKVNTSEEDFETIYGRSIESSETLGDNSHE